MNACTMKVKTAGATDRLMALMQSPQMEETRASQIRNVFSEGKGVKGDTQVSNTGGVGKGGELVGQ